MFSAIPRQFASSLSMKKGGEMTISPRVIMLMSRDTSAINMLLSLKSAWIRLGVIA